MRRTKITYEFKDTKTRKDISTRSMIERLLFINRKIKDGTYPNAKLFVEQFEVSIATVNRDIEFLRDRLGAPLEYDSYRRGYFYSQDFDLLSCF